MRSLFIIEYEYGIFVHIIFERKTGLRTVSTWTVRETEYSPSQLCFASTSGLCAGAPPPLGSLMPMSKCGSLPPSFMSNIKLTDFVGRSHEKTSSYPTSPNIHQVFLGNYYSLIDVHPTDLLMKIINKIVLYIRIFYRFSCSFLCTGISPYSSILNCDSSEEDECISEAPGSQQTVRSLSRRHLIESLLSHRPALWPQANAVHSRGRFLCQ